MPNISSLTMPDGIVYSMKDAQVRKEIEEIKRQLQSQGKLKNKENSEE